MGPSTPTEQSRARKEIAKKLRMPESNSTVASTPRPTSDFPCQEDQEPCLHRQSIPGSASPAFGDFEAHSTCCGCARLGFSFSSQRSCPPALWHSVHQIQSRTKNVRSHPPSNPSANSFRSVLRAQAESHGPPWDLCTPLLHWTMSAAIMPGRTNPPRELPCHSTLGCSWAHRLHRWEGLMTCTLGTSSRASIACMMVSASSGSRARTIFMVSALCCFPQPELASQHQPSCRNWQTCGCLPQQPAETVPNLILVVLFTHFPPQARHHCSWR